jgi:protein SCO1/2
MSLRRIAIVSLIISVGACRGPSGQDQAGGDGWAGWSLDDPIARPDFVLTDTDGEPFDFAAETEGGLALLFFGYTYCPDVCPVQMANLAEVVRDLPFELSSRVKVVFVTTDPNRDTPERLQEWLGRMHPDFIGLRGSLDEVRSIQTALGLPPPAIEEDDGSGEYFVGHAAQVIAFEPDGPARRIYPYGIRQREWLQDIPRLLGEGGGDTD